MRRKQGARIGWDASGWEVSPKPSWARVLRSALTSTITPSDPHIIKPQILIQREESQDEDAE
jgi:hypothetical protein